MDSDRLYEKMATMNDKTKATAIANSDSYGLQIGETYEIVNFTAGENGNGASIKVLRIGDANKISLNWKEYRTSFDGTIFAHDDWAAKDQITMLND